MLFVKLGTHAKLRLGSSVVHAIRGRNSFLFGRELMRIVKWDWELLYFYVMESWGCMGGRAQPMRGTHGL